MNSLLATLAFISISVAGPGGDVLVKKIEAVKFPKWIPGKEEDKAFMKRYLEERAAATKKKNALILELFKKDPSHPKTVPLMRDRWREFESGNIGDADAYMARIKADVVAILKTKPSKQIVELGEAAVVRTEIEYKWDPPNAIPAIETFVAKFPKSEEGPSLILEALATLPAERRPKLQKLFLAKYPDHKYATMIRGAIRQADDIGKPFELKFTEAISGTPFDIASLRGKVVVLDFWATWCGPCVAKMPELKKTLEKYRADGLEVVGISLDLPEKEGGLKALKEYVAKNGYGWPQYYQGNGWESDFSKSWGIMSIPNVFLIDRKGNLRKTSVNELESAVKELLAES